MNKQWSGSYHVASDYAHLHIDIVGCVRGKSEPSLTVVP